MKAITYHRYGGPEVLELADVDDPEPRPDEVRVHVVAASANPRDWHYLRGLPQVMRLSFGLRRPKEHGLGSDVAGVVDEVGSAVTRFAPGDEVIADVVTGAFAESVCVAADLVARKPANLSFEAAAAIPLAALTALQGVRDAGAVQPGQKVLVIGAAGGVGTFAVQLASDLGASVTGVCRASKAELVRSLGAVDVVDYAVTDVSRADERYDLVFQLAGTSTASRLRHALTPDGMLLVSSGESDGRVVGPMGRFLGAKVLSPFVSQRLSALAATRSGADLEHIVDLIEAGTVRPVVDRTYALADVPQAIRYLEQGHASGKVVITVA